MLALLLQPVQHLCAVPLHLVLVRSTLPRKTPTQWEAASSAEVDVRLLLTLLRPWRVGRLTLPRPPHHQTGNTYLYPLHPSSRLCACVFGTHSITSLGSQLAKPTLSSNRRRLSIQPTHPANYVQAYSFCYILGESAGLTHPIHLIKQTAPIHPTCPSTHPPH